MTLKHHRSHRRHPHRSHRITVPVHRARRALATAICGGGPGARRTPGTAPGAPPDAASCKAERH